MYPGFLVYHARSQCECCLVGIVDAVATTELILGKDARQVQVTQRRVKIGYAILILVRDIDIEQARFKSLRVLIIDYAHVTVKIQTAVHTEDRERARFAVKYPAVSLRSYFVRCKPNFGVT